MKNRQPIFVYTDFDGTISQQDLLDYLLDLFAPQEWRQIEAALTTGKITEHQALQQEFALLTLSLEEAIQHVLKVPIDPYFKLFTAYCQQHHIPLEILSGGFQQFILAYLKQHQLDHIPFRANTAHVQNGKWEIIGASSPKIRHLCNHCKTYWVQQKIKHGYIVVYIGDGNTDRCPAMHAHYTFAKDKLAHYLDKHHHPYFSYQTFQQILEQFPRLIHHIKEKSRVTPFTNTAH